MITAPCGGCRKKLRIRDELAGKKVICRTCGITDYAPKSETQNDKLDHSAKPTDSYSDFTEIVVSTVTALIFLAAIAFSLIAALIHHLLTQPFVVIGPW